MPLCSNMLVEIIAFHQVIHKLSYLVSTVILSSGFSFGIAGSTYLHSASLPNTLSGPSGYSIRLQGSLDIRGFQRLSHVSILLHMVHPLSAFLTRDRAAKAYSATIVRKLAAPLCLVRYLPRKIQRPLCLFCYDGYPRSCRVRQAALPAKKTIFEFKISQQPSSFSQFVPYSRATSRYSFHPTNSPLPAINTIFPPSNRLHSSSLLSHPPPHDTHLLPPLTSSPPP